MNKEIKVAACQMHIEPGNPALNSATIIKEITKAIANGDDIIVFPEMAVPGYLLGDEWENEAFVRDCVLYDQEIIAATKGVTAIWGNVSIDEEKVGEDGRVRKYNAAIVAQDGRQLGISYKTLMPKYREFDDERYFYSLRKMAQDSHRQLKDYLNPYLIELNSKQRKVGVSLCEDMWNDDYTLNPIQTLLDNGAEFIINISCSPWTWRKNDKRHRVVRERIKSNPVPFIYVNNVGSQNNGKNIFLFDGSSTFYNPDGSLAKVAAGYKAEQLRHTIFAEKQKADINAQLSPGQDKEELLQGLIHGIRDFYKKIGAKKTVIGISGGIDSSLSAALFAQALGGENIYAINMPSMYNSETTKSAARKLAQNLGLNYTVIPIQHSYEYTVDQLNDTSFTRLDGSDFITKVQLSQLNKENIQARDRGSRVLAGVASALGAVFINNGNKTETALGYSTLYGDVNGALAPLADLYKMEVYELGKYINEKAGKELIPQEIFDIPASAELSEEHKVDEGKGDPIIYPYHDKLMRAFVEFRLDPQNLLEFYKDGTLSEKLHFDKALLQKHFDTPAKFIDDLEHKWKLFKINYFKRIQAPPIFAVSRRAFGFDLRESQNNIYFTKKYLQLKSELLKQ
jgi:NAD+ synthase (glutamine-hydrolysing)